MIFFVESKAGVNDHPHSGWFEFYRHRREKTGARNAPVVAGETGCETPGLENPIKMPDSSGSLRSCQPRILKKLFHPGFILKDLFTGEAFQFMRKHQPLIGLMNKIIRHDVC